MTFRRFEDIKAWQAARALVAEIYSASGRGGFARDFGLRGQVRRAAVSIMANIAEGFLYRSDRMFTRFLLTARASAMEVQSHLYVAMDQSYLSEEQFRKLYVQTENCAKQLGRLISYLVGPRGIELHPKTPSRKLLDQADQVDQED